MHLSQLGPEGLAAYDVVIVGTSFAALPIVEALGPSRRVLLIDGGAPDELDEARELTRCDEYGHFADGHWSTHWVRAIGGTSVRWSGVVGALHADDLQGGRGRPAWPIARSTLDEPYARACRFLDRPAAVCAPPVSFGPTLIAAPLSHDTPRRLRDEVLARTRPAGVDLLSRHTVVRLVSNAERTIAGLVVTDPARASRTWRLAATQVLVLACGGLGNAQILLEPGASGVPVGNESGLVGRFLMEHPHVVSGDVLVKRAALPATPEGFGPGLPAFRLTPDVMAAHDLLPCSLAIQGPVPPPEGGDAVQRHFEAEFGPGLEWAQLYARAEQEPAADNRVELLPETTWAGTHRLRTHCSFSSRDLRSIEVSTRLVGEALLTRRIGVVRLHNRRIYRETFGGGHTMGTTRMGASRADSVCDAQLRVHGYANLYLAGSSVFPTGGAINPTLTIVALSYRLGAHLETRLAGGGSA
jgi:choline dehydrogenase-like flavoprotein